MAPLRCGSLRPPPPPLLLLLLLLALAPAVHALDRRVTGVVGSEASNIVGGVQLGLQYDTLHNALAAASTGDTILVEPGQWSGVQDVTLLEAKTLYLRSSSGPLVTALRGSEGEPDEDRVTRMTACADLHMPATPSLVEACPRAGEKPHSEFGLNLRASSGANQINLEIEGFTFHNFGFSGIRYFTESSGGDFSDYWGAPDGGVFRMDYAQLTLRKSIAHNNKARRGGVVYMESSVLDLDTVILRDNVAREQGGAIYSMLPRNVPNAWDILSARTIFQGNQAGAEGGGLFADSTAVKLDNVVFTDKEL